MHTLLVITGGFVLLGLCVLVGALLGGAVPAARASAAKYFIPLWFIGAAINLWVGVARAGYSVADEAPIFAVVFGVPAAVALFLWRRFSAQ